MKVMKMGQDRLPTLWDHPPAKKTLETVLGLEVVQALEPWGLVLALVLMAVRRPALSRRRRQCLRPR